MDHEHNRHTDRITMAIPHDAL